MNIKPLWLGHVLLWKLHNIGFGVSTEYELSVSLSPFGMFFDLLRAYALASRVWQAPDNEPIDFINNVSGLNTFAAIVVEPDSEQ